MSTTYLTATNEILKELNEVNLSSATFSSATGIHSFCKDIINRAYFDIVNAEDEWPFLIEGTPTEPFRGSEYFETVAGTQWYLIKTGSADTRSDYKSIDWDNIYITTYGVAGASSPYAGDTLSYMTADTYRKFRRDNDNQTVFEATGYDEPDAVLRSADGRYFGLSPIPDKVYRVYFNAWIQPSRLSAYGDEIVIPDNWINVLYARARYYMWQFKESPQQAAFALAEYEDGIKDMRRSLMEAGPDYITDDRIRVV